MTSVTDSVKNDAKNDMGTILTLAVPYATTGGNAMKEWCALFRYQMGKEGISRSLVIPLRAAGSDQPNHDRKKPVGWKPLEALR